MQGFVQAPPQTTIYTNQPIEQLIDIVASRVGGQDDPEVRSLAALCLDRAADYMNSVGLWLFRLKETSYTTADGNLTDGQFSFTLPDDWGWPYEQGRAYLTNDLKALIYWIPWQDMRNSDKDPTSSGSTSGYPNVASMVNESEGVAYVYPKVSTTSLDTLVFPYYSRVQRISEETNTSLLLTPEIREALLCGGEFYILQHEFQENPGIYQPLEARFYRQVANAKGAGKRRTAGQRGSWARVWQ